MRGQVTEWATPGEAPTRTTTPDRRAADPAPYRAGMGFNPHRPHRRSPADYVMVVAALAICVGLVLWAALG